jgi:ribosomal protein S6E (S10)
LFKITGGNDKQGMGLTQTTKNSKCWNMWLITKGCVAETGFPMKQGGRLPSGKLLAAINCRLIVVY